MQPISQADIGARIARDNPWWNQGAKHPPEAEMGRRVYFKFFKALALDFSVKRAAVLLGPRRVGKTVMAKQLIHDAITGGMDPCSVFYASIDAPVYSGTPLEHFLKFMPKEQKGKHRLIVFDEIQYLPDWQRHLKDLVDSYPNFKFVVTGSAAAALRLRSKESGAGRFSHFILPPLTFYEFLEFSGVDKALVTPRNDGTFHVGNLNILNEKFIDYLNFGGYPEAVMNPTVRKDAEQYIRNDIVDKVLLKDLPSLYGIHEIPELNRLFSVLAYNAGNEASLENLSQSSGISKPTITKYIQYLESAFLITKVAMVDDTCRTFKRERNFKIYLNNPSMRAALFAPVTATDTTLIGQLAECAIFSQFQHSRDASSLRYARWKNRQNEGEVDVVFLGGTGQTPIWAGEIKWSDRLESNFSEQTKSLEIFAAHHKKLNEMFFTTKTLFRHCTIGGKRVQVYPTAYYCYAVGRNITSALIDAPETGAASDDTG